MPNHDPGWNDPPTFSYNGSIIGSKRTLLNRRVAFPVSSTQSYSNPVNSSVDLPLSGNMQSPVFIPAHVHVSPVNEIAYSTANNFNSIQTPVVKADYTYTTDKTDEEMLIHILSVFDGVITKIPPDSAFRKKTEDIKNRLKIFEEMWKNNSLSLVVKQKMFKLAEELSSKSHDEAHALHCNLIVDHVSEVSQWMVAVKHIVLISKTLQESVG